MKLELKIENYKHKKGKKYFFDNIGLNLGDNGFHLLTGNSGVGKTTLIKIILGIEDGLTVGNVKFTETENNFSGKDLIKNGMVGYQPDDFSLIPWLSISENIKLPSKLNQNIGTIKSELLIQNLESLGLSNDILEMKPHQISFGMKARVNLIRACITKPKVIILDELYSGIDQNNCDAINKYLKTIKENCLIIAISHQLEKAKKITDTIHLLEENSKLTLLK